MEGFSTKPLSSVRLLSTLADPTYSNFQKLDALLL
jgi:hypothetical protein